MIQLLRHKVYQESIDNITQVLRSGWTGLGPKVEEFEKAVAKYLNTPYTIALNSGTAALQIALMSLHAPHGSFILTTPLTFISTNHSILQAGYYPIFCDVESDTGNIDPESIERFLKDSFIGSRVKGIMAVHYAGMPVDLDAIYELSTKYNIDVIEDAAHAFGAEYQNEKIGCLHSKLVCFSFHSVKPLAIGDGGLITTYDPAINEFARRMRWCGINKDTTNRTTQEGYKWDYDMELVGYKAHMNDIQAAIGLGQLQHYEEDKAYRQILVDKYRELLSNIEEVELLKIFENRKSSNHLMVIKAPAKMKTYIMDYLYRKDIHTGCHYRLSIDYPMYRKSETDAGCKNAREFFNSCISLPLHLDLTLEDVEMICNTIKEGIKS